MAEKYQVNSMANTVLRTSEKVLVAVGESKERKKILYLH